MNDLEIKIRKIGVQKPKMPQFCFGTNDDFEQNSKLQFTSVWYNISKGEKMKKDNNKYTWKDELWSGIGQLILAFAAIGIGLGIAFLLPHETIKDIPAELFFMLGGLILFAVIGIVALTIHLIRQKRKNNFTAAC